MRRARKRFVWLFLSALELLSLDGCVSSPHDASTARVDRLFAELNKAGSPGCSVGISRNGSIVYSHGYGMASVELGVPRN